jgi:hypothetical protein
MRAFSGAATPRFEKDSKELMHEEKNLIRCSHVRDGFGVEHHAGGGRPKL